MLNYVKMFINIEHDKEIELELLIKQQFFFFIIMFDQIYEMY